MIPLRHAPLCLALFGLCCERNAEAKAEAGKLSHAIDVLRGADNAAKRPALTELRALPCARAETCGVQSACVAAYELHLRGLEGVALSKQQALAGDAGADLPALIAAAQDSLERGRALSQKCADAQGELVRRYHLH